MWSQCFYSLYSWSVKTMTGGINNAFWAVGTVLCSDWLDSGLSWNVRKTSRKPRTNSAAWGTESRTDRNGRRNSTKGQLFCCCDWWWHIWGVGMNGGMRWRGHRWFWEVAVTAKRTLKGLRKKSGDDTPKRRIVLSLAFLSQLKRVRVRSKVRLRICNRMLKCRSHTKMQFL